MEAVPLQATTKRWLAIASAALFVLVTEHVGYAVGAPLEFLVLDTTFGLLFVASGAIAWHRRPTSATGPLLVLCAVLWSIGSYSPTGIVPLWALGFAFEKYYDVALAVLALSFPGASLSRRGLAVVGVMAGAFAVRSLGRLLLADPPRTYPEALADHPTNPFALLENRAAFESVETITSIVIAVSTVTIMVLAVRRLARTRSLERSVIAPVLLALGVAMLFAAFDAADTAWATTTGTSLIPTAEPLSAVLHWLLFIARALVPLGFLVATLRLRAPTGPLVDLAERLEQDATPDEVDAALRAYIENDRLADRLTAQLAELRASRARIVSAGDEERRRIERALHDGAQQHLTAVSIRLDQARQLLDGREPALASRLDETATELKDALHELRELARGIHPAILSDAGLQPALATLVRRSTVPVELSVRISGRLPHATEVTAYYVVAESLNNVARSAQAEHAWVDVAQSSRELRIEVRDDGRGGADPQRGSGILGLQDRVRALDGRFRIESPIGGGTRIEVRLPCA